MVKLKDLVEQYGNREVDEAELAKILKPVKKTIYDLEYGDVYWAISGYFRVLCTHENANNKYEKMLSVGNVFLTEEDVEFEIEKRKVEAELKRYASMCEEPIDWTNHNQAKICLAYDHVYDELDTVIKWTMSHNDIFFTDEETLDKAIKGIGLHRIVKYYFGAKE